MKTELQKRVASLEQSAAGVMAAIDAHAPAAAITVTYRLYIAPSGRKYVTVVGTFNSTAFAEVMVPASDGISWDDVLRAVLTREADQ